MHSLANKNKIEHPPLAFYLNIVIYNKEIIVQATVQSSIFVYFALVRIKVEASGFCVDKSMTVYIWLLKPNIKIHQRDLLREMIMISNKKSAICMYI